MNRQHRGGDQLNNFERTLKKQEIAFAVISTLLLLLIFGVLAINEGIQEQEDIRTFEKALEAERESNALQEEAITWEISYYKNENHDLELTNDILADYIQMKQQELEELK